ncbi:MAG: YsnF/AvaK domain-containing protein [Pseudomonadota bacterium]
MAKTVVGLMDTREEAQSVVRDLVDSGFDRSDIGLMASQQEVDSTRQTGSEAAEEDVASGAMKGAGAGAILGGAAGLLVGIAAIPIPGIGPIIAAGPIASALAGAGVGAVAGGGIGALTNVGVPENEAQYYAEGVRRGGTLITVTADDDDMADRAAEIMRMHGALDIDERAEDWRASGWVQSGANNDADFERSQRSASARQHEDEQVLPVVKEELQVGKRAVQRGGVRIYSHVTERPVEETVRLREEHASIERRPVNQPLSAADDQAFREQTIEVRETSEEPVVGKRARVTEEVVIGKQTTEREETVRDTVRETDVDVERISGSSANAERAARTSSQRFSTGGSYGGPERRRNSGSAYAGIERRA